VFRSRAPRAVIAALTAVVLIVGLMASATSAAPPPGKGKPTPSPTPTPTPTATPTPTPTSDNRMLYFGWPETGGDRQLQPSAVTTGNVFVIDMIARSDDNQTLTHPRLAIGTAVQPGGPDADSLPTNATILSVETSGVACVTEELTATSYSCDLPNFVFGDSITAHVTVQAGTNVVNNDIVWATFKVAEKVNDQGANQNTAFASSPMSIQQTNSNANATYKLGGEFSLSTNGPDPIKKDPMTTTVSVPDDTGVGAISISEENCDNSCTGQIATVHVRDGGEQTPYLLWKLVIVGSIDGVITHTLDEVDENGDLIEVEISEDCVDVGDTFDVDCIVSNTKNGNATTIEFRTETNGKVRAN
jgi:hypothetical protein